MFAVMLARFVQDSHGKLVTPGASYGLGNGSPQPLGKHGPMLYFDGKQRVADVGTLPARDGYSLAA
ncbi:MAG: hypothetical protein M1370_07420 [Bacteroidetes bacterium]|nr:hypothetical protein [Bacteroidota bacterium]